MKIIVSQIGYDVGRSKHALVMDACGNYSIFELISTISKKNCFSGEVRYWGEKWNHKWAVVDFPKFDIPGDYLLRVMSNESEVKEAKNHIHIGNSLLWHETWYPVSVGQLDVRAAYSYKLEGGWKDCGSDLQELSSHIIMLTALCDLLETNMLTNTDRKSIYKHIIRGAEYLLVCQTDEGAFVHEIRQNMSISTGNCANASMCLARIGRLIKSYSPSKSIIYINKAILGYNWIRKNRPIVVPFSDANYTITHGAPVEMQTPPNEYMTRDLLALLSAAIELYINGKREYENDLYLIARQICSRQISKEDAEYGFYGQFRTYQSFEFSEKADLHCGAWNTPFKNYNQGSHFPHRIIPILKLMRLKPSNQDYSLWFETVKNFAYGYFLPACESSPFGIIPAGIFQGQGLCFFSGWYHGHTKIYGYAAELAELFFSLFHDMRFRVIADGNIQWIAGLNSEGISLIAGIGDNHAVDWNELKGTIINGFDASKQFSIEPVLYSTDLPTYLDDEGGIHHCAGYLSGLCAIYGHDSVKA